MSFYLSERMQQMQPSAIREILKMAGDPSIISFAAGNPAPEAFPSDTIARITSEILAEDPIAALQYSVTEGYAPLRTTVATFLQDTYGIGRADDQLIIVSGAQQAMDFACKVLCDEGDAIVVESPSFVGALNTFRSYKLNLIGVPMDEEGICLQGLEEALANNKIRFIYLIPTFQNPTGITMSLARRHGCYALAKKYNVPILEDNPYGELRFRGEELPPIKSFDEEGLVIYVGTFSKILAPGIRVGFVSAPSAIAAKMVVAKQCNDVHSVNLSQIIAHRFMTNYDFAAHLQGLRDIYRKKSGIMLGKLDELVGNKIKYTRPDGGLFIWCELPEGVDMPGFVKQLLENKLAVVPGNAFMTDSSLPVQTFRMNFSTPTDEQLIKGVQILAEELGVVKS